MSSVVQRAELQSQIWKIANDVRGSVDGWDFKQYVLGTLFYRFISENFAKHFEQGDDSINYAEFPDDAIPEELKIDAIKTKGYFMTIALPTTVTDTSKYIELLSTFSCK